MNDAGCSATSHRALAGAVTNTDNSPITAIITVRTCITAISDV
jgi:hypothetical protein